MVEPREHAAASLRIGIMVNSLRVPAWVAKIVSDIESSGFAQIVLVIRNAAPSTREKKPLRQRLKTYWTHSFYERYRRWDYQRHCADHDAFATKDLSDTLRQVSVLDVKPIQKGFVDRFSDQDLAQIRDANLDVLFRFGFRIIRGAILSSARHGVWSFHHGDNREYRGAPPGFWEIYEKNPVTGSILQILTDSLDGGRVIYRSLSATHFGSLYLSLNPMYWKTAEFALRRLRHLHRFGGDFLQSLPEFNEPNTYKKEIYRTPPAPVMFRFLARLAWRKLIGRLRLFFLRERTHWFMAVRPRSGDRTVLSSLENFKPILPPPTRFYADPFLIKQNGSTYLFFENFDFAKSRASISYMQLDSRGQLTPPAPALETGYHLSYPCVFESAGALYMIPETRARNTIELYRAAQFPDKWVLVRLLAENILAVDATVLQHAGKFWLFANIAVPGASTFDELHLFFADSLDAQWTPHPANPIVSDVTRARPAGAIFLHDGKLIRPSQDCSLRYGYALAFNQITVLSESAYHEKPCARIEPTWFPGSICTHTYNRTEEFEVLDGMQLLRRLRLPFPRD